MIRRLVLALLLALVAAGLSAAAAAACSAPRALKFSRTAPDHTGKLSWRAPRGVRGRVSYRVWRDRRVVGQTRRRSMPVAVEPGRRVRFTVRAVGAGGRLARCAASRRMRVRAYPPSRPRGLVASVITGSRVQLSWAASRRGDGRFAGYRVLRDGVAYQQTRGRFLAPRVAAGRRYSFAVAAVDTQGRASRPSAPVRVDTSRVVPPAPANVTARPVSDSEIELRWDPSALAVGQVAAYRVLRDGAVVGQSRSTSIRVGRLAPAREYAFQVAAVDSRGTAGPLSAQVVSSTQPPPPTEGTASAFLLASTGSSFADLQRHYRRIGVLYPTYFDCNRMTAAWEGRDDPLVNRWAQARKLKVLPRFNCQVGAILNRILNDPETRRTTLDFIIERVSAQGYDGAQLDFEIGYASDRDAYTSFVAELGARLRAQGRKLSVAVSPKFRDNKTHPRSGFFDYPALAQHADDIFAMTWGIHWTTSAPGPMSDLPWATAVVDYIASMPNRERFTLGTPLYGMDWAAGGGPAHPAAALSYPEVQALIARYGRTPTYDPVAQEWHFDYVDEAGVPHEVWYFDARVVASRLALARSRGLGIGFWRLGQEDPAVWELPELGPAVRWPTPFD